MGRTGCCRTGYQIRDTGVHRTELAFWILRILRILATPPVILGQNAIQSQSEISVSPNLHTMTQPLILSILKIHHVAQPVSTAFESPLEHPSRNLFLEQNGTVLSAERNRTGKESMKMGQDQQHQKVRGEINDITATAVQ